MPQGWLQFRRRELGHLRENNVLLGLPLRLPATVVFHCRGNSEDVPRWQIDFQICGGCAAEPLVDRILMVMCVQIRVSRTSAGPSGSFCCESHGPPRFGFPRPLRHAAFVHPQGRNRACRTHACWCRYSRRFAKKMGQTFPGLGIA